MKTTNHTPGPWDVSPYNNVTSRNGTVAKTEQMPGNDEAEQKANAHLISAAPDLLSALQEAYNAIAWDIPGGNLSDADSEALIDTIRAAIAKAEGEA